MFFCGIVLFWFVLVLVVWFWVLLVLLELNFPIIGMFEVFGLKLFVLL